LILEVSLRGAGKFANQAHYLHKLLSRLTQRPPRC
jgi:hypothetical protein